MVAFQDGTIHDVATKVGRGTITKIGMCLRAKPEAVTVHMMQFGEQMSTGNL